MPVQTCIKCDGRGWRGDHSCESCGGTGVTITMEKKDE